MPEPTPAGAAQGIDFQSEMQRAKVLYIRLRNPDLHERLKAVAKQRGQSLNAFCALKLELAAMEAEFEN